MSLTPSASFAAGSVAASAQESAALASEASAAMSTAAERAEPSASAPADCAAERIWRHARNFSRKSSAGSAMAAMGRSEGLTRPMAWAMSRRSPSVHWVSLRVMELDSSRRTATRRRMWRVRVRTSTGCMRMKSVVATASMRMSTSRRAMRSSTAAHSRS